MKLLYIECRAGISGDMAAAALLDLLGEDAWGQFQEMVAGLPLADAHVHIRRIRKSGFAAVEFSTGLETDPPHRSLGDIEALLADAGIAAPVRDTAIHMFRRLARAEAEAHGTDEARIHFHEVGAADSIIDILAASWAHHRLSPDRVICSALPLGEGTVQCAHGELPVPAPATLLLTRGVPVYGSRIHGETVTPTGAVIATTLAHEFGPLPACIIHRTGVGAGQAQRPQVNVLRTYLGEMGDPVDEGESIEVVEIQTSIDDMNPEAYAPLMDELLEAGALDVHLCPVQMKKGRPGTLVSVLSDAGEREALTRLLLTHTSTFGVRYVEKRRVCLQRLTVSVQTKHGQVRIKEGLLDGKVVKAVPEHDDCRALSASARVPYLEVYEEALSLARKRRS